MDYCLQSVYNSCFNSSVPVISYKQTLTETYLSIYDPLNESTLSYAEFQKQPTSKRPDRKQIFLKKYSNKEPFKVNIKGVIKEIVFEPEEVVKKTISNLAVNLVNPKSLEYKNAQKQYDSITLKDSATGQRVSIKNLIKADEFKGQGSGGGSDNTTINEESVCLWLAVYQDKKIATFEIVKQLAKNSKITPFYLINSNVDVLLSQTDKTWLQHYERVAQFISQNVLNSSYKYTFHRKSKLVDSIYEQFKILNNKTFADANKWNPADIWAISVNFDTKSFLAKINTIKNLQDYNNYLKQLYQSKQLIGISLKKTLTNVHATEFNTENSAKTVNATLNNFAVSGKLKGIFAKDVFILGILEKKPFTLQFRSFTNWKDFQGEIKGTSAAGGKVARGQINRVLLNNQLEPLPSIPDVLQLCSSNQDSCLKSIFSGLRDLDPNSITRFKTFEAFKNEYLTKLKKGEISEDYVFSKYFGIKLIAILSKVKDAQIQNKVISEILNYAFSSSELSAPFVKIS